MFTTDLDQNQANHSALTPTYFLSRAALANPNKVGVIYGDVRRTWKEIHDRCLKLASALSKAGIGKGDTVAALLPNLPELLELHYAIPMLGAVINAQNTRLDAETIAYMLEHSNAKVFFVDEEYYERVEKALKKSSVKPLVINVSDPSAPGQLIGKHKYEEFLASGDDNYQWEWPADEWDAIALNYTSGTTGKPKGVVYHHRGAYLNAMSNALGLGFTSEVRYLWTLPMFHCNGWCFPWAVTAVGGTHICLRQPAGPAIFEAIAEHKPTHFCAAPVVLNMMVNTPEEERREFDHAIVAATGGAAPPAATIQEMQKLGINVVHLYGLTETYGPSMICEFQEDWQALDATEKANKIARQGIPSLSMTDFMVANPETLEPVPKDGTTIGELMVRGNSVMKGYLCNKGETLEAFADGWFHTGDLGVWYPDSYVEIKDRSKDIIISGGENISSLEVESVLYQHEGVFEAAVVACDDKHWGEIACAFVVRKPAWEALTQEDIVEHCRTILAGYKCPKRIVFIEEMPKTSTGKFQKHVLRDMLKEGAASQAC